MIGLAILAAGASTRFGSPKQLARVGGQTLVERAVRLASGFDGRAVIVLGAHADDLRPYMRTVETVVNHDWEHGLSTSIHAAVRALSACEAIVIALADQPDVGARELQALVERHRSSGAPVVAAAYGGTVGVPALFARAWFERLLTLRGDTGARVLLRDPGVVTVSMPQASRDIDFLEDL